MINGYKTKIAIIGALMYAIGGFITGNLDANAAFLIITTALGGFGLYDKVDRK